MTKSIFRNKRGIVPSFDRRTTGDHNAVVTYIFSTLFHCLSLFSSDRRPSDAKIDCELLISGSESERSTYFMQIINNSTCVKKLKNLFCNNVLFLTVIFVSILLSSTQTHLLLLWYTITLLLVPL